MNKTLTCLLLFIPFLCSAQTEVGPETSKLFLLLLIIFGLPAFFLLLSRFTKRTTNSLSKHLRIDLQKDRKYRPSTLTLSVKNNGDNDVDLECPVLIFRKYWRKRKFKLTGINQNTIYPLYLEAGKTHELRISLSGFHKHDHHLARYYWAKVLVRDTRSRKHSSRYISLRKSLFS